MGVQILQGRHCVSVIGRNVLGTEEYAQISAYLLF